MRPYTITLIRDGVVEQRGTVEIEEDCVIRHYAKCLIGQINQIPSQGVDLYGVHDAVIGGTALLRNAWAEGVRRPAIGFDGWAVPSPWSNFVRTIFQEA